MNSGPVPTVVVQVSGGPEGGGDSRRLQRAVPEGLEREHLAGAVLRVGLQLHVCRGS